VLSGDLYALLVLQEEDLYDHFESEIYFEMFIFSLFAEAGIICSMVGMHYLRIEIAEFLRYMAGVTQEEWRQIDNLVTSNIDLKD